MTEYALTLNALTNVEIAGARDQEAALENVLTVLADLVGRLLAGAGNPAAIDATGTMIAAAFGHYRQSPAPLWPTQALPDPAARHNALAPEIVRAIVRPIWRAQGNTQEAGREIFTVTESVLVGIALAIVKSGGDEPVIDAIAAGAKARLAESRLANAPVAGQG